MTSSWPPNLSIEGSLSRSIRILHVIFHITMQVLCVHVPSPQLLYTDTRGHCFKSTVCQQVGQSASSMHSSFDGQSGACWSFVVLLPHCTPRLFNPSSLPSDFQKSAIHRCAANSSMRSASRAGRGTMDPHSKAASLKLMMARRCSVDIA